jgi:hypothetical protein
MVFSADLWAGVEHTTTTFYPVKWMCPLCIEIPVEKKKYSPKQNSCFLFWNSSTLTILPEHEIPADMVIGKTGSL